jgi:hypothetical protein
MELPWGIICMKFSLSRRTGFLGLSSMLLVLLCLTAAHAQQADDAAGSAAKKAPPAQVAGTWTGTDNVDDGGSGTCTGCPMTLTLVQDSKRLGGTFSLGTADENPTGPISGKISGSDLKMTFHANSGSKASCKAMVVATVDGDTMSGAFTVKHGPHCKGKGTFDLTKQ